MISEELKEYIAQQIKEATKAKPITTNLLVPDPENRLDDLELWMKAVIASLLALPPELGSKETLASSYNRLKKKKAQDIDGGIAEFLAGLERDGR